MMQDNFTNNGKDMIKPWARHRQRQRLNRHIAVPIGVQGPFGILIFDIVVYCKRVWDVHARNADPFFGYQKSLVTSSVSNGGHFWWSGSQFSGSWHLGMVLHTCSASFFFQRCISCMERIHDNVWRQKENMTAIGSKRNIWYEIDNTRDNIWQQKERRIRHRQQREPLYIFRQKPSITCKQRNASTMVNAASADTNYRDVHGLRHFRSLSWLYDGKILYN